MDAEYRRGFEDGCAHMKEDYEAGERLDSHRSADMTPAQTDVDLMPCPFCEGTEYRLQPGGQTWMGVKGYSEPQYWHLYHNGTVPEGDGFQICAVQIRARTEAECIAIWNNTIMEGKAHD